MLHYKRGVAQRAVRGNNFLQAQEIFMTNAVAAPGSGIGGILKSR
jgi:hypothetical protein